MESRIKGRIVERSIKYTVYLFVILLAVLGGFVLSEGVFVGVIADQSQLSRYPWGSENGWIYRSPNHYMALNVTLGVALLLPLFALLAKRIRPTKADIQKAGD